MILVLDNYDSFVHNIVRYVHELGAACQVLRNDEVSVESIVVMTPSHLILSPGPCTPTEAGICVEVVRQLRGACPVLGVCLGHQCIAEAYGARVVRAEVPMHGKTSAIHHEGEGILRGLPSPFLAARSAGAAESARHLDPQTLGPFGIRVAATRPGTLPRCSRASFEYASCHAARLMSRSRSRSL